MAYTGVLGHPDSMPGNLVLAGDAPVEGGGGLFEREVEDVLAIVDEGLSALKTESVASEMVLVDEALVQAPYHLEVSSVLTITDEAISSIKSLSVASTLSMTDEALSSILDISVTDTLTLTETLHANIIEAELSSVLSMTDEVAFAPGSSFSRDASSDLGITDTVFIHFGVANLFVETTLAEVDEENPFLQDFVNLVYDLEITDTISLTDLAFRLVAASNTLELVETIEFNFGLTVEDEISLTDSAERLAIFGRSVSTVLELQDTIAYYVETASTDCEYGITVGEVDDPVVPPPSATPPTLGTATLTLTWPYVTPTTTLVLRNPEFGNTESLDFTRINRTSRGGTQEVFADPDWPQTTTLNVTIDALTTEQADDFLEFLGDSLGQEIGLLDWENRQWRGIITTPDAEVTDQGKSCRRSITFEFEGEVV